MTLKDALSLLLQEEKWIRAHVVNNPERGRRIAEVQKAIGKKIASNNALVVEAKVNDIIKSYRPQSKVFNIRRNLKKSINLDFPLKDKNGVVQVGKEGIDTHLYIVYPPISWQGGN